MSYNKTILCCYGVGGHNAQMDRLMENLSSYLVGSKVISLSDKKDSPSWASKHYLCGELRSKHKHIDVFFNSGPIKIIKVLKMISSAHNIDCVISTGPGLCLLAAVYFKLKGASVIHVETWSRFKTKSFTGRLMYKVADKFYVQNRSLLSLYPNGIYSGLL